MAMNTDECEEISEEKLFAKIKQFSNLPGMDKSITISRGVLLLRMVMAMVEGDFMAQFTALYGEDMAAGICRSFVVAVDKELFGEARQEEGGADVAPVRYGRWVGDLCSVCGVSKYNYFSVVNEESAPFGTWRFCPGCGARMDEEVNNGEEH